jgi:hypothetical protein
MRSIESSLVQIRFGSVDHVPDPDRASLYRRAAAVTKRGRREHRVTDGEQRNHVLPHTARHGDAVHQHHARQFRSHA